MRNFFRALRFPAAFIRAFSAGMLRAILGSVPEKHDDPKLAPYIDAAEEAAASDEADAHREFNECWRAKEPTLTHVEKTLLYAIK